MSARSRVRPLGVLAASAATVGSVLVLAGCSHDDVAQVRDSFCTTNPRRDVSYAFRMKDDPTMEGNLEMARAFMRMEADDVSTHRPAELAAAADVYAEALRNVSFDQDPLADLGVRAAVDEMNAWLVRTCGPPPATTP